MKVGAGHLFLVSFQKGLGTMNKLIIALLFVIIALSVVACNDKHKPNAEDGTLQIYLSWECDRKVPKNDGINKEEREEICSQYSKPD
ncbi:hypothetical protein ACFL3T_03985 [Patescibacteria group bacterium]